MSPSVPRSPSTSRARRGLNVVVRCSEACQVFGRTEYRGQLVGLGLGFADAGEVLPTRLQIPTARRRILPRSGSLRLVVRVRVRDGAGNERSVRRIIRTRLA